MQRFSRVLALSCAIVVAATGAAFAFGGGGSPSQDVANEKEIRQLYSDFVELWNKHDVETLAGRWAIDGDHIEPDGRVAKGRDEVAELLEKQHTSVFAKTTLRLTVATVWFITAEVVLVDGDYSITGIVDPAGRPIPERGGHLTSVLLKEKGQWWIAASRLMIPAPLPYKPPSATEE